MPTKQILSKENQTDGMEGSLLIEEIMLNFYTPDLPGAGTNARVCFEINAQKYMLGDGVKATPNVEQSGSDHFEKGQNDTFFLKNIMMPLADLRSARLRLAHDGAGLAADWFIARFEMQLKFSDASGFKTYKEWPPIEWVTKGLEVILQQGAA